MSASLSGVLPVLQTQFHQDESVDFDTLARETDWLLGLLRPPKSIACLSCFRKH